MQERYDPLDQPLEIEVHDGAIVVTGPRATHRAMTVAAAQETLLRLARAITQANAPRDEG